MVQVIFRQLFILRLLCLFFLCQKVHAECFRVPNHERYKYAHDISLHPGHKPFISHITFRNLCDHIIDQSTDWFDPSVVHYGDTIYLNIWYLDWFTQYIHDKIQFPYILVTGDVGNWIPEPIWQKLLYDPKLAAWFGRNMLFSYHPKLYQIPMGQDWSLFNFSDQGRQALLETICHPEPKNHLLYMNHYPREHGDRHKLIPLFENEPYCFSRNKSGKEWHEIPYIQYYKDISSCYFTLSPLGWETDCVRTWEALVLDSIPIVEHTFLDPSYADLPVLIIDDWKDINESFLKDKYEELKDKSREQAYFQYWEDIILKTQEKVKDRNHLFSQLESTAFHENDLKDLSELFANFHTLFYRGFLSAIRPLQLASALDDIHSIHLYDPWLKSETFNQFSNYLSDPSFLENRQIIHVIDADKMSHDIENRSRGATTLSTFDPYAIFLDLTYYRHSLVKDCDDFSNKPRDTHLLKRDLVKLFNDIPIFTFLCGNGHQDPYVQKALKMLEQETNAQIEYKGSFWYLTKGL